MRIYIHNNTNKSNNKVNSLEPYFHTIRTIYNICNKATGDIMQIENNRIYRMKPASKKSEIKTILGIYPVTIKGEPVKGEECYQIPPQSREEILTHKVYKKGLVEWIFVYNDENVLLENYFSLPDGTDINNIGLLEFLGERGCTPLKPRKAKQAPAKQKTSPSKAP